MANTEKKKAQNRAYYQRHRLRLIEDGKAWYRANRDHVLRVEKIRYLRIKGERPDHIKKLSRKSYFKNRDARCEWFRNHHKKQRIEFLLAVGDCKCAHCGFSDWRALQIDHIHGDGNKERKDHGWSGRTWNTMRNKEKILTSKDRYQILCANCNSIKKYDKKESRQKGEIPEELRPTQVQTR